VAQANSESRAAALSFYLRYPGWFGMKIQYRICTGNQKGAAMPRLIPAAERITRARKLIQKARGLTAPEDPSSYFSYVAQVKDLLQQARDLIKFISYTPSATPEMKAEVAEIKKETEQAEKEILRK
jgi:hypothetical protein